MRKPSLAVLSLLALLVLGGCVTMPTGPSVMVLPAPGKPFEQFMSDDALCRQWGAQQVGMGAQETANTNTARSAGLGTLIGAGAGAVIGAATGSPGAGAAIGAGSGLLLGTASGASAGEVYGSEAQRRYDNAYVQCMYAKGNQVPGTVRTRHVAPRGSYPPPDMYSVPPDYYPAR